MKKFQAGILCCFTGIAFSGCQYWQIEELHVIKNQKLYVEVWGKNMLVDKDKLTGTPDAEIKIYSDAYVTLLTAESFVAGDQLANEEKGAQQIFSNEISDIRVGNSSGQYKVICVEFRLKNSNFNDYMKAGCVYTDGYNGQPNDPTDGPFPASNPPLFGDGVLKVDVKGVVNGGPDMVEHDRN